MLCCTTRKVQMALKLNGLQAFKLHNYFYTTTLKTYLRPIVLSRVELKVILSYKNISTTLNYSKASLIDFGTENKDNYKKYTEIDNGNKKLDDFVEGLSKSRIYRDRRKKSHHERRTLPNLMPSSPTIPIGSKDNIYTDKELLEPISKNLYKAGLDKNKINGPLTTVGREELKPEKQENTHMSLENIKITGKFNEKNNNEFNEDKPRESSKSQPLNYSSQKVISKDERYVHNNVCIICTSVLQEFLDNNQQEFAFSSLKEYQKQDKTPAFPILLSLAYWGGHNGRPDVVKTTEFIAQKYFNSLFKKNLNFENHLAIAHMKAGEVTESFKVLEIFLSSYAHTMYPKISKKKKDILALVMNFLPTEKKSIIDEAEVFINKVVEKEERVSYALSLWKVCFISEDYYCQQVAERLLVQHPSLVFMIAQKLKSIVDMSVEADNQEMLYRLLQLLLRHDLQQYLILPTAGILKIQCKSNDIAMAHETLLFAKKMNIRLDPQLVQYFYKVLQEYRRQPRIFPRTRIFPRPAPKEIPKRFTPPSVQYKF